MKCILMPLHGVHHHPVHSPHRRADRHLRNEVLPECRGRGLATLLIAEALRSTRAAALRIVPTCWMVAGYIDKNPDMSISRTRGEIY